MKLLWTISNWKHTGPVEPSLDLARAVARQGHDVRVEVGRPPDGAGREAGVLRDDRELARADVGARLHKHAFLARDLPDRRRLTRWIEREAPDVLVATLPNDHRLLLAAAQRAGDVPVIRLWFADGESDPPPRERDALLRSARIFVFGDRPRARLLGLGIAADRIRVLGAPLDVDRIRARATDPVDARQRLGTPPEVFLFGIVARLQTHRRYEMLWAALQELARTGPPLRLAVLGRGTKAEEVAYRPVREHGLEGHVVFGGYLQGEAYASAVAAFDAQLLLVPGSDPTCRALREGMALAVPSVATRRGLLPSIVQDGITGRLVDEDAAALATAMAEMASDPEGAARLGAAARDCADERFRAENVAQALLSALP